MRTKALLIGAAIGAIGLATSMAQVYSVNVVGYVNVTVNSNAWKMLTNPLKAQPNNEIQNVIPSSPVYLSMYKWDTSINDWRISNYDQSINKWDAPTIALAPGQGFWIYNWGQDAVGGGSPAVTLTFVGDVTTGTDIANPNQTVLGWTQLGSVVPQAGLMVTDLAFNQQDYDTIYRWDTPSIPGDWTIYMWDPTPGVSNGGWGPVGQPSLGVAEGCWVFRYGPPDTSNTATYWTRTFNIN